MDEGVGGLKHPHASGPCVNDKENKRSARSHSHAERTKECGMNWVQGHNAALSRSI
jgi:hypothetical protein